MKQLIALLAAAGILLAACDKNENQGDATPSGAPSGHQTQAPAHTPPPPAETPAPDGTTPPPAGQTPAGAPGIDAAKPTPAVDLVNDPRRASAEGTLGMFIDTMRAADYESALELLDPSCDGYSQVQEALTAMINVKGKGDGGVSLEDLYKTLFTKAWQNATPKKVGEQEGHFQYVISFESADPVTVDIRNATGAWLIIAPTNIFVIEQMQETPEAPAATTPPPAGG